MTGPQAGLLEDGRRLHLNHGPIDLIVEAFGDMDEVRAAYEQAVARFQTVLTELVEELPELRRPAGLRPRRFAGPTARRMEHAVCPHAKDFITSMAAVAGSVADEILAAMLAGRALEKAYVNNGGDSALHLAAGREMRIAIAGTGQGLADRVTIRAEDPMRGVATSGWRGRSHSLGIADVVTVLAKDAAAADAAATIIANAVDLPDHPSIERAPASSLQPDSDLGERLVTVGVGALSAREVGEALDAGLAAAEDCRKRGLVHAVALFLGGESRVCGTLDGMNSARGLETIEAPSPPRFARHLSPISWGRGTGVREGQHFLAPAERGRGAERSEAERGHHHEAQRILSVHRPANKRGTHA